MADAASGAKALTGTWEAAAGDADGTAGHFRIYASDGTTAHMQGTVTVSGGAGDMTLSSIDITTTKKVTITASTLAAANS